MNKIISRTREQNRLQQCLDSKTSEFVAIYGRRRVGKTYLIREFFLQKECIFLHTTGIKNGSLKIQLKEFIKEVSNTFYNNVEIKTPSSWMDAFDLLTRAIDKVEQTSKVVLFLDELPWMSGQKSGLLMALEYYWNRHWVNYPNVRLVVCGSSASWIIKKLIHNTGGLYNRITVRIKLMPFSLSETIEYLHYRGIKFNQKQALDAYMVLGGIPFYLRYLEDSLSVPQNINQLCFQENGPLYNEFDQLFASLFNETPVYKELVKIVAAHANGTSRTELETKAKLSQKGGSLSQKLEELEEAGFITSFISHGHTKKGLYYKITDEYILFYLRWVAPIHNEMVKKSLSNTYWIRKVTAPAYKSWAGYAFEAVCFKHIEQISKALQIPPGSMVTSWRYVPKDGSKESGAQIDLLFDRDDGVITLCEIKYSATPFLIDNTYAREILQKIAVYQKQTATNKRILFAMITTYGLKPSIYSKDLISATVSVEKFFKSVD
jgi:uncharacterized protein